MEQRGSSLLTTNELICTNIASIVGISVLYLASSAVKEAKQDAWIATLLGGIYPLYIVFISTIIIKRYPNTSIMELSKQFFGKVFGNILNLIFMSQFLYYVVGVIASANNLLTLYSSWFMKPVQITSVFVVLTVYLVSRGLKSIARVNVITFFLACIILSSAVIAFFQGNINNIKPIFGSGVNSIFSGVMTTVFSYATMEILVIIHPYVKNKKKILKAGLISTILVMIFYTWSVFACTIYLGTDIVPKIFWPFSFVSESVKIPLINNFRFIWMLLWPIFVFRTIATEYYMSAEIMNHIFNIGVSRWCVILSPIIFIFPLLFENESARRNFYGDITKWVTIFNLLYVTVIAILVHIKRNEISKM